MGTDVEKGLRAMHRRWRRHESEAGAAFTQAMLRAARVEPGACVLDLACGPGEPALSLARAAGADGRVTATDLDPAVVRIARGNARADDVGNVSFAAADAHRLPFPDQAFDLVTCRLGVMYFAQPEVALRDCRRALRPGGRAVLAAWGPAAEHGYFAAATATLLQYARISAEESGVLKPFRFAEQGALAAVLRSAGLEQVEEERVKIPLPFPGTPEKFWEYRLDFGTAFRPTFESIPAAQRDGVKAQVLKTVARLHDGRQVNFSAVVVLVRGIRG